MKLHFLMSAALAVLPLVAQAQDSDAVLRKRVDELEKRLMQVEAQLKKQQAPAAAGFEAAAPAASPSGGQRASFAPAPLQPAMVSYPVGWLKVKEGLSQDEVKALIGPAHKSFQLNGSEVWYYAYSGVGVGSVFFDSTGHASGYQRPSSRSLW